MVRLFLTQNRTALLSDEDKALLYTHSWCCAAKNDVQGVEGRWRKDKKRVLLHHLVLHRMGLVRPDGHTADHINGDRLDNRRENLRWCLPTENSWNTRVRQGTRYKGVKRHASGRFGARIMTNGMRLSLGTFVTEIDAARAYDDAARRFMGSFARLNFPNA